MQQIKSALVRQQRYISILTSASVRQHQTRLVYIPVVLVIRSSSFAPTPVPALSCHLPLPVPVLVPTCPCLPIADALAEALAGLSIEKQAEIRTAAQGFYSAEPTDFEKQAAALDLTRTLATVLKPQKPEPYEGAIDAEACFNFIENQEEYFNIVGLDETLWTKYTAVSLRDDAKAWWRSAEMTLTTPWPIFRKAFTDYHTPPNAVAAARTALENLRQNKMTVATYTHKFRRHLRLIPSMDSRSILHTYMKGLEPNTSKEVRVATTRDPGSSRPPGFSHPRCPLP